jgi:hypothetical protein
MRRVRKAMIRNRTLKKRVNPSEMNMPSKPVWVEPIRGRVKKKAITTPIRLRIAR